MLYIYRRTPMPKWDFKKVAKQFIEIALWHECSPVNLLHIFRTYFPKNTFGKLLLKLRMLLKTISDAVWFVYNFIEK